MRRDLELFKAAHVNFIRSIYYPFSEKMLELCDEMGFWVENTAPFYELGQTYTYRQRRISGVLACEAQKDKGGGSIFQLPR